MKFINIELKDYRQFFGRQTLTFASGIEQNITLINGNNGAGKTHLFEAINWCLYGELIENRGALVSKEKALIVNFSEIIDCSVSIWFSHEGKDYLAQRIGYAQKLRHDRVPIENEDSKKELEKYKYFYLRMLPSKEEDFKVFVKADNGMKQVNDPTITIDRALPSNARQYFLFDGEKIEQLSRPEHDNDIREAVKNVLQLPSIQNAINHLKIMRKEYLGKAQRSSRNIKEEDLFKAAEDLTKAMEIAKEEHIKCLNEINNTRKLKDKIENDLRKFISIKELTKRRDDLQSNLDSCEKRIKESKRNLADLLSNSHIVLSKDLISNSISLLELSREKGQMPPGIRETFIQDLIDKAKCICGNDLTEGCEGYRCILNFLENSKTNTILAEELTELFSDIKQIEIIRQRMLIELKKILSLWITNIEEYDDIAGRLEDVHNQIKKVGDADISKLEISRKQCEDEERALMRKQVTIESSVSEFLSNLNLIENELRKIEKTKTNSGEFARLANLTGMAINVFETVYEEYASRKRKEIETKMKDIFLKLIWKKDQFPDVRLTDQYCLELYDKWGSPARDELSAGERQVLSLSFITAMAFVTGGTIPLIMDTPFGRLFKQHRLNIAKEIPAMTNQWALLVQDEELNSEMREILRTKIGQEYILSFNDGCTTIEEVL